jgi:hypothetical protein
MSATSITYDSFNLNNSTTITGDLDDASAYERELDIYNLARTSGAVISDSRYRTKHIMVSGQLQGTSPSNLESLIDTFHAALSVQSKNLDIGYNGTTRRYVSTPAKVSVTREVRAASWAKFEIDFIATDYGQATSSDSLYSGSVTTPTSSSVSLDIGGSAPDQYLDISVTIGSGFVGSTNTLTVSNPVTGQTLSITRAWTAADVAVISCKNQTVTVNGTEVDYSGAFPAYSPGNAQSLTIGGTFYGAGTTFNSSSTYTPAAGITRVFVEAWGGGAAGGGHTSNGGGGGGGGGAYAAGEVTVVPATSYTVTIGAAGTASTGNGGAGGNTSFNVTSIVAAGGSGGGGATNSFFGAGGLASASTGTYKYDGGSGGTGSSGIGPAGGGGGAAASSMGAGTSGESGSSSTGVAGTSVYAGSGGDGRTLAAGEGAGTAGTAPGGGGGGAFRISSNQTGGAGSKGRVVVYTGFTYTVAVSQTKYYQ